MVKLVATGTNRMWSHSCGLPKALRLAMLINSTKQGKRYWSRHWLGALVGRNQFAPAEHVAPDL